MLHHRFGVAFRVIVVFAACFDNRASEPTDKGPPAPAPLLFSVLLKLTPTIDLELDLDLDLDLDLQINSRF